MKQNSSKPHKFANFFLQFFHFLNNAFMQSDILFVYIILDDEVDRLTTFNDTEEVRK